MGRIKTKLVKRTAHTLMKQGKYKKTFDENKQLVTDAAIIHSKKLRNVITGYVTRLSQRQKE